MGRRVGKQVRGTRDWPKRRGMGPTEERSDWPRRRRIGSTERRRGWANMDGMGQLWGEELVNMDEDWANSWRIGLTWGRNGPIVGRRDWQQ